MVVVMLGVLTAQIFLRYLFNIALSWSEELALALTTWTVLLMAALGVKAVLPSDRQSNTITAYYLPEGVSYRTLHDRLKADGYVIYAGQGNLESKIFRVANMGALTDAQFTGFLNAFEQACRPA